MTSDLAAVTSFLRTVTAVMISLGVYFVCRETGTFFDRSHWVESTAEPVSMASIPQGKLTGCSKMTGRSRNESGTLICRYQNLCYSNLYSTFFIHVDEDSNAFNGDKPSMATVKTEIHLTAALNKVDKFTYMQMTSQAVERAGHIFRHYRPGKYILFSRVTASNIVHDIHDVLLPLFFTLEYDRQPKHAPTHTQICLFREDDIDDTEEIYRLLSKDAPILERDLKYEPDESAICFEEVTVGLSKAPMWYQWGLSGVPEGPLSNPDVTSDELRKFTSYVKERLNIRPACPKKDYGVLFIRKRSRRIVNGNSLAKALSRELSIEIFEVSLEKCKVSEIIEKLSCAKLGIGMHGAIMILAMFLPKWSALLEMFPYAINPDNHQPYRQLTQLPGMDIEYLSWRNINRSSAVIPTKRDWIFAIDHLSAEERRRIEENTEVTAKPCCNDPEWKYRMYHDTIVDIQGVTKLLKRSVTFTRQNGTNV